MSVDKVSQNKTGTLFYTKLGEGQTKPYRVRFRSFHLGVFQNKEKVQDLQNMHTNYNLFKYGKAYNKRNSMPVISQDQRNQKTYKNMNSRRCTQSEQLKTRLKSMRETRKSILYKIKNLND